MITVYGFSPSGNCHKVKLLLEQLGCDYRWIETDSARGETRTPEYLAKNPNGKVPMIELDDGRVLVESNAILCWLAERSAFLPADPWQKAQALSWLFFEQYSHEPYIAVARFICGWTPLDSPRRADLPKLRERPCGVGGDGASPVVARLVHRRGLRHRRYRAVRLHLRRAARRHRVGRVSRAPRLAGTGRGHARVRADSGA